MILRISDVVKSTKSKSTDSSASLSVAKIQHSQCNWVCTGKQWNDNWQHVNTLCHFTKHLNQIWYCLVSESRSDHHCSLAAVCQVQAMLLQHVHIALKENLSRTASYWRVVCCVATWTCPATEHVFNCSTNCKYYQWLDNATSSCSLSRATDCCA